MFFISLNRFRRKATKAGIAESDKLMKLADKEGIRLLGLYWTLGRYDSIAIWEANDEKTMMKAALRWGDQLSTESLTAVPRDEAVKLLE